MARKPKNVEPSDWVRDYLQKTGWSIATPLYMGHASLSAIVSRPTQDPMRRDWRLLTYSRKSREVSIGSHSSPLLTGAQAQLINHLAQNGDSLKFTERKVLSHVRTFPRVPVA